MQLQLLLGTFIVIGCALFHAVGLVSAFALLQRIESRTEHWREQPRIVLILGLAVLLIVLVHTAEVWAWALIYFLVGEFEVFETALYFSAVTSTTLGFGDITLSEDWRLMSSFEGMSGLILFGASTAFLIALTRRIFEMRYIRGHSE